MCQVNPGKVDYVKYRYWLLHDPNCTKTAMQHINDVSFIGGISFNLSAGHERPSFHGRHMYDSFMIVHNLCIVNNI